MIEIAGGILLAVLVLLFLPLIFQAVGLLLVAATVVILPLALWAMLGEDAVGVVVLLAIGFGLIAFLRPRAAAWLNSRAEAKRHRQLYGRPIAYSPDHLDWANRRGRYADPE